MSDFYNPPPNALGRMGSVAEFTAANSENIRLEKGKVMFTKATALSLAVLATNNVTAFAKGKETLKKEASNYVIEVQDHAAQPALVIKGKVAVEQAGDAIGSNIQAIGAYLEKEKIKPAGAPFTRTYAFEKGILEFETGFPLETAAKSNGTMIATELPKAKVVKTVHEGGQATSENAYNALHAWMKKNKKQPAGAPWEVYVADDRMEVFFPIR